jgi:hypothetical protein
MAERRSRGTANAKQAGPSPRARQAQAIERLIEKVAHDLLIERPLAELAEEYLRAKKSLDDLKATKAKLELELEILLNQIKPMWSVSSTPRTLLIEQPLADQSLDDLKATAAKLELELEIDKFTKLGLEAELLFYQTIKRMWLKEIDELKRKAAKVDLESEIVSNPSTSLAVKMAIVSNLSTSLQRRKRGRPLKPKVRDFQILMAVAKLVATGAFLPTRSHSMRRLTNPSACSIVQAALARIGEHKSERTLEGMWTIATSNARSQ